MDDTWPGYAEYKSHFKGYAIHASELYVLWVRCTPIEAAQRQLAHRKREYALRSRVPRRSLWQCRGLLAEAMLRELHDLSRHALDDDARAFVEAATVRVKAQLREWEG